MIGLSSNEFVPYINVLLKIINNKLLLLTAYNQWMDR